MAAAARCWRKVALWGAISLTSVSFSEEVHLAWIDESAIEQGFEIERSVDGGEFVQLGETVANETTFIDRDVQSGSRYDYRLRAFNPFGYSDYTDVVSTFVSSDGNGQGTQVVLTTSQIGGLPSEATTFYDEDINMYLMTASGLGYETHKDEIRFSYVPVGEDFSLTAQVHYFKGDDDFARVGLMLREGLADDARHASVVVNEMGSYESLVRSARGEEVALKIGESVGDQAFLRIQGSGGTVSLFYSHDALDWELIENVDFQVNGEALLGLAIGSQQISQVSGALVEILESNVDGFVGTLQHPDLFDHTNEGQLVSGLLSDLEEALAGASLVQWPDAEPIEDSIDNGDFEAGMTDWRFYTNGSGRASIVSDGSDSAMQINLYSRGSNIQLYQNEVSLEPNTEYTLSFDAYSNTGHDVRVSLAKHSTPYTNYGINKDRVDLTTEWQTNTITFTTRNFGSSVSNGRLYFWLADDARPGDRYMIDNVRLVKAGAEAPVDVDHGFELESEPGYSLPLELDQDPVEEELVSAIDNGGFETDISDWTFYTNGRGSADLSKPGYGQSESAVLVKIDKVGSNIQLYQNDISLLPNTSYRLSFAAYSNVGRDMSVSLFRQSGAYVNYGLSNVKVDLGTDWEVFTIEFTTGNFDQAVDDGRLIFWFADRIWGGERYYIDEVKLTELP